MRWLKSFLSPTISCKRQKCLACVTLLLALTGANTVAHRSTPACGPNGTTQVLRIDRRTAQRLLLSEVKPSYPALARINYIGGHVRLIVTVDCQGKVEKMHVLHGHPFLAVAALDAIRRWVYHPFETKAGPAAFQTLVDVNFSLAGPPFTLPTLPPQPEKFLARGIRPPQVVSSERTKGANRSVRLRVLVSKKGRAVDSTLLSGSAEEFALARATLGHWRFRPARWGNLAVPWYMEVNVPVRMPPGVLH
jgi:TonB family protein